MRADLTFMALADESNRYQLTKSVAKVTRMLHRPNTRVQDTMNEAFKWLGRFKPGAAKASIPRKDSAIRPPAPPHDPAFDPIGVASPVAQRCDTGVRSSQADPRCKVQELLSSLSLRNLWLRS